MPVSSPSPPAGPASPSETENTNTAARDNAFLLVACSPRAGGNTDTAARAFARGFTRARAAHIAPDERAPGMPNVALVPTYLRSHRVAPCISCYACARAAKNAAASTSAALCGCGKTTPRDGAESTPPAFGCPLTRKDDSTPLLQGMCTASGLCFVSPIYFYHLPAVLKGLIDRTQPFWALHDAGDERFSEQTPRVCHIILLGARTKGQKLFEGSLLTFKHALAPLNIRLAEPLLLYGLEHPGDLAGRADVLRTVEAYGETAGAQA